MTLCANLDRHPPIRWPHSYTAQRRAHRTHPTKSQRCEPPGKEDRREDDCADAAGRDGGAARAQPGERRDRLLEDIATRPGFDRDEYPPAVGRGRANGDQRGLVRGINPVGWMADVMYVPSSENRSHGSTLGAKLRRFCNRTRFRYVFY